MPKRAAIINDVRKLSSLIVEIGRLIPKSLLVLFFSRNLA